MPSKNPNPIDVIKQTENKKNPEVISKDSKFLNKKITSEIKTQSENKCLLREIKKWMY